MIEVGTIGKVGFYIGRFQPPHKGHVHAVKYCLERVDELIIGIGSSQFSHEDANPFTTAERFTMLRLALEDAHVDRRCYDILPVPDTNMHHIWVAQLTSHIPKFDVVFSNDPLTSRLLRENSFTVERIPFLDRRKFNATLVRKKILENQSWEELVPGPVANFIRQIGGVERIRELAQSDNA